MSNQYDDENQASGENPPDDFANFDPAAYVRKHREEVGEGYLNEDLAEEPLPVRGRGRQRASNIEEPISGDRDEGDLGLGAALLGGMGRYGRGGYGPGGGGFRGGRRIGLLAELIGGIGIARRLVFFLLSLFLFLACIGIIAIAYVISMLTRR